MPNKEMNHRIEEFIKDTRGTFAIITAIAFGIIAVSAGFAIDFNRARNEETNIQKALDAAALAGVIQSTNLNTASAIEQAAQDAFKLAANTLNIPASDTPVFNYDPIKQELTATLTTQISTSLGGLFGVQAIPINVTSTAQAGISQIELVLAIDQSSSMRGTRQTQLLQALDSFTNSVYNTNASGGLQSQSNVYVGVVPWQANVNPGLQRGLKWAAPLSHDSSIFDQNGILISDDPQNLIFDENTPRADVLASLSAFNFATNDYSNASAISETDLAQNYFDIDLGNGPNIQPADYPDLSWRGCLLARDVDATIPFANSDAISDFDHAITARAGLAASPNVLDRPTGSRKFNILYQPPGWSNFANDWKPFGNFRFQDGSPERDHRNPNMTCPVYETTYLTNDATKVVNALGELEAKDDIRSHTDSSIGIAWALRMLSPDWATDWGADFTVGNFNSNNSRKILVLLSDGQNGIHRDNLVNSWTPYANTSATLGISTSSQASNAINIRTLRLCELAKNLGVEIYTVAFDVGGKAEQMLQNCASTPTAPFFQTANSNNSSSLLEVFQNIANSATDVILTN